MPAIPSCMIVSQRRHPSRLPCGSRQLAYAHCRSALTGPGGAAQKPFPERREWQALSWQLCISSNHDNKEQRCK
jgi:hypothetical protein